MTETFSTNTGATDTESDVGGLIFGIGSLVMPFVRMYLGPTAAILEREEKDPAVAERRLMLFAVNKLVVEAGTLPVPGTAYEPHNGVFTIDERGQASALDLRYVLAAARALAGWATAEPKQAQLAEAVKAPASNPNTIAAAPVSARSLRMSARASGYGTVATPTMASSARTAGGCGCRGGTASTTSVYGSSYSSAVSTSRRTSVRRTKSACADPKPSCDCGGTCGGRNCDCIPRSTPPTDACSCGSCKPPAPEACTPWTPSCETRNRLRACLKDVLCDLLRCVEDFLCPRGQLDPAAVKNLRAEFITCLTGILCKLLRCVREAICPAPRPPELPCPPIDCLPCSYAVEETR